MDLLLPVMITIAIALASRAYADNPCAVPTDCALNASQKALTQQLTAFYDFGVTTLPYCQCSDLLDGNGMTCGFAGFTSESGSLLTVMRYYSQSVPDNIFLADISALQDLAAANSGDSALLTDLPKNWFSVCLSDPLFIAAQKSANDERVYNPSQAAADTLGLKYALSRAAMYDAFMQQGANTTNPDSVWPCIANATAQVGGTPAGLNGTNTYVDEVTWLKAFLQARRDATLNPVNLALAASWASTVGRIDSVMYVLYNGDVNFANTSVSTLDVFGIPTIISL
ncbi:chitosanase [Synchytrium endobioticum]|uniref:Chitosanase n=1 Tax=Synchytrium endobioticum TaxID=286115 RepID=A0A507DTV3_9FUNG|nr:chitosanase [Synchytrium endobioticum]TPX54300.1 chitosanase [Synchytrium endobioticum]